ncbi:MAG: hypothetical protein ACM3TN_27345 [Alphaproteobacteria bacterium]
MHERIYTKAQKDASWKENGLLRLPKSHDQGMLALASKEFIEGLGCYSEVRRMLAAGKRPRDVGIFIQQHDELPRLTFNTLKKYAQVYRAFFMSPVETLRVKTKELRKRREAIEFSLCISPLDDNVFPLHVSKLAQTPPKCLDAS